MFRWSYIIYCFQPRELSNTGDCVGYMSEQNMNLHVREEKGTIVILL